MRVVDENRGAVALTYQLEPALGTLEMASACEGGGRLAPCCDRKARGDQRVLDLKGAGKRQPAPYVDTRMGNPQHLREPLSPFRQGECLAPPPYGQQPQPAPFRGRDHGLGVLVIGGHHRRAAWLDQIGEQTQLGGEIGFERRMVIEMVATEIGECAGRHAQAVEPMLIEPMRRSLDRKMSRRLHPRAHPESGAARPGRASSGAVDFPLRRNEPDRADARGLDAERVTRSGA